MVFDVYDFEFLRLCGLCRYLPARLRIKFDIPYFDAEVIATLRSNGYIKMQNDKKSYKLTFAGKEVLADMGYTFPDDLRMDLTRKTYHRKIKNAMWNVILHLAGIDVFLNKTSALAGIEIGYVSSLTLRTDENIRVLAGTRFLGILKIFDTVYMPYYIEGEDDWIVPAHELDVFKSQISNINSATDINLILIGETLEELWGNIHPQHQSNIQGRGMKRFDEALEILGYDYSLVPADSIGSIQLSIMKIYRYRQRIAKALGCSIERVFNLSECDGFKDNIPYIIAIDFNIKRILRALKQIKLYNKDIVPKIFCFKYQKELLKKALKENKAQDYLVMTLNVKNTIEKTFKDEIIKPTMKIPYTKGGGMYVNANQKKITKADIEEL